MLKLADTLDIEITGRIAEWLALFWDRYWHRRVPLLPGWGDVATAYELRFIARKRRRCTLVGHIWEMTDLNRSTHEYTIQCGRCHPHIDSRRVIVSYNPFSTVQRKTD